MAEGDTLLNALIGGAVTILTSSFVPFSPLLGGAVAGYLEGGDRSDGVRVGLYAGLVALVPAMFLLFFVTSLLGIFGLGIGLGVFSGIPEIGALGIVGAIVFAMAVIAGLAYLVGLSAVGGWLGNYVKHDTEIEF